MSFPGRQNLNSMTKIYILAEPDGRIRYVGKTRESLRRRLCVHLSDAKRDEKSRRCNWIRSILAKGFLPKIELVGEAEGYGCREEIAWIKYFRDEGVDLVNTTDGGDGRLGYIPSKATRMKISTSSQGRSVWNKGKKGSQVSWNKGKTASLATRQKQSESHQGAKNWSYGKSPSKATRLKRSKAMKKRQENCQNNNLRVLVSDAKDCPTLGNRVS